MNSSCIGNLPYSYDAAFAHDLTAGLSRTPKSLPCKWFYDDTGSQLFEKITKTPEYYLTRVETRLLEQHREEIAAHLSDVHTVVEPGSGSSTKTRLLLKSLPHLKRYVPIDIATDFMLVAAEALALQFPDVAIDPHTADFSSDALLLPGLQDTNNLIFFPGSTIGNFAPQDAASLLTKLHEMGRRNAQLLIGVDMTQDEARLLDAYNDAQGITASFNLNLLLRANRELGTDFDLATFTHSARYNQQESRIEMHLVSSITQSVHFHGQEFHFAAGETIHTESCYKYQRHQFEQLAHRSGWQVKALWQDTQESEFALLLLKPTQ